MRPACNITLITVDLDDTLWPCAPVIRQAEAAHFEWLQQRAARLAAAHNIDSLRAHRSEVLSRRPDLAHDLTAVRTTSLRLLLEEFGHPAELAQQATRVFLEARNRVAPFPDVAPVLHALRREYRVASLTNGNADVQRTPLKDCFHFSLTAAGVGAAKPAPDLFLRALAQTGVEPGRAVHVGDDPERDVAAAREVGMHAVWVNRSGTRWPAHLDPPDTTVTDLHQLRRWLGQPSAQPE